MSARFAQILREIHSSGWSQPEICPASFCRKHTANMPRPLHARHAIKVELAGRKTCFQDARTVC